MHILHISMSFILHRQDFAVEIQAIQQSYMYNMYAIRVMLVCFITQIIAQQTKT